MGEFRRLGKRGAYALGELRRDASPKPRPRPPARRRPSFAGHRSPRRAAWWLAGCALAAVPIAAAAELGLWFAPFVAGLVAGAVTRRTTWRKRSAVPALVVAATVGWAAPLCWSVLTGAPEGATARVIAALAGIPPHAAVAITATLLIAVIQALSGLWLATALTPRGNPA
jgi:4-hydroxybenzoate polyprenyltransferase